MQIPAGRQCESCCAPDNRGWREERGQSSVLAFGELSTTQFVDLLQDVQTQQFMYRAGSDANPIQAARPVTSS